MLMKKRMKTKFDYQARTFGACVILMLSFTLMFVSPSLSKLKKENASIEQHIELTKGVEENNKALAYAE